MQETWQTSSEPDNGMSPRSVAEIRRLLGCTAFLDWQSSHQRLMRQLATARRAVDDPVTEHILRIGDEEDRCMAAEAVVVLLASTFETLARAEQEAERAAIAWANLQRAEVLHEHLRRRTAQPSRGGRRRGRLLGWLDRAAEARSAARVARLRRVFHAATWSSQASWREAGAEGRAALRAAVARPECRYRIRRMRKELDSLRRVPPRLPGRGVARPLVDVLESELRTSLSDCERRFGCVAVDEFLYWPELDAPSACLVVPLIAESDLLNLQIEPLRVYRALVRYGVDRLEPLASSEIGTADATAEQAEEDRRLAAFFAPATETQQHAA